MTIEAANSYWINPAGGAFNDPANWAGGVPGMADSAYFTNTASYQVTWAANATNSLSDVASGVVTNALGSATWWITSQYLVGHNPGDNGAVSFVSGTIIVTNSQGHGTLSSGQSGNRNFTLDGGTAMVDYLDFLDDGGQGYSKFLDYGTLTTLHGSQAIVGNDLVFEYNGGKHGTWNMSGGTNNFYASSVALLYTQLGWAWDSQYTINVNGPNTVWNNNLYLVIGNTGGGHQVNISGGAKVFSGDSWLGRYGSSDSVTVSGANSSWNIESYATGFLQGSGYFFLSENASGCQLIITNGGQVSCGLATITRYTSGTGNSVLVTGGGSLWNVTSNLVIGDYGTSNSVTIANGGRINCQIAYLGGSASSTATGAATNNSMWITDSNSLLNATNGVRVGSFAGRCSLVLTNGARVQNNGTLVVGSQPAASNDVLIITGAGTVCTNSSSLTMGSFGSWNTMILSNGAQLFDTRGVVGNASASNLVVVTGAGSLWNNSTELYVGNTVNAQGNQLFINNNGTVLATNVLVSVSSSAVNNVITIAGGNLLATNSAQLGNLDVRRGTLNLLSGLTQADRLWLTNGTLSQFYFKSGRLDSRNSTISNTQPFIVGSGSDWAKFNLKGGTHSFANDLSISGNAWLTGSGTLAGNVTNAGALAPGDPLGSLTLNGNLQLQPNSDLAFDLSGHTAGVDYDSLTVSGNIFWNGRLHVTLATGFTPGPSDVFTLAQCGGGSGSFANVANGGTLVTEDGRGSFLVTYGSTTLQLSNFQALTPTNAFKLTAINSGPASVTLRFPFEFGRTYHLWFSTNLTSWVELPVPGYLLPQPGVAQWTDDGSLTGGNPVYTPSPRFYRISMQ